MENKIIICDGCNVELGHIHRCQGENALVRGESTGKPCECRKCKIVSQLFSPDCEHQLKKIGTWDGKNAKGEKIAGPILKCKTCKEEIRLTWGEWDSYREVMKDRS
jgi:hypothetical protein